MCGAIFRLGSLLLEMPQALSGESFGVFSPLLRRLSKLPSGLLQVFAKRLVRQLPWRR